MSGNGQIRFKPMWRHDRRWRQLTQISESTPEPSIGADQQRQVEKQEMIAAVRAAISTLEPADRRLIERRFGFYGGNEATLQELAQELCISHQAVSKRLRAVYQVLKLQLQKDYGGYRNANTIDSANSTRTEALPSYAA